MASIIVPSNLTVTISESYELNGVTYGNTLSKIYTSNSQVSQRVMNIEGKGDGTVFTNTLNLGIYNGTEYFAFEVSPASTFLLQDAGTDSPATASTVIAFSDITLIAGQSSSVADTVDVEFIIVTA